MAKSKRTKRKDWTAADVKQLRSLARKKSAATIARALKRSVAAVRFKAHMLEISLALK